VTDDDEIRSVVARLARPNRSGGSVIERAAILASGHDATAILEWITAHDGVPEAATAVASRGGLHSRFDGGAPSGDATPRRYVLPPGALD